jgi:hypothetical protein
MNYSKRNNIMHKRLIVCVDCAANFSQEKWSTLLNEYECEIVGSVERGLAFAAKYRADAIVATCPVAAANIVMRLKTISPKTPVILLEADRAMGTQQNATLVAIEKVSDTQSLVKSLKNSFSGFKSTTIVPRHDDMGYLHWPISVLVDREGKLIGLDGTTITVGHGGLHGKVSGSLELGEKVLVEFSNSPDDPPRRAQVRCRHNDVYGLAFDTTLWDGNIEGASSNRVASKRHKTNGVMQ